MAWLTPLACFVLPLGASLALTGLMLVLLRRIGLYDQPNERSLHRRPTPRGGGLAPVAVLIAGWAAVAVTAGLPPARWLPSLGGALLLAATGWRDDCGGLSPVAKLVPQLAAVGLGMIALADGGSLFQGWLPPMLDRLAAALLWLWFVNLYNFMDGSDGLAAGEAATIGLGLALVALWLAWPGATAEFGLVLAGAALGFLWWNRPPARLFLGDAGSLPLGYLIGWLLLDAAGSGHWAPALILPGYFLADASVTLARRAARGDNLLAAHAEHFYQRAVRNGLGHGGTLVTIMIANLVLIAFALGAAEGETVAALLGAGVTVLYLLHRLARRRVAAPE
jgi:UDP-N-acetylmuramyl pentapeptide phosphotransferase/UDP-N-acetylglucosamine-1-phosphate transferase